MKQKISILIAFTALLIPFLAKGAGLVPCGGPDELPCDLQDLFILIARVTNLLIALAGVYATYVIIGAGFWMGMTMGNEEKYTQKIQTITNAVLGLVLAMMGYMMINTTVNWLLKSKCKIDSRNPLMYLKIYDPKDPNHKAYCERKW